LRDCKCILSLFVANELIKRGFNVVEVKPSTKKRGNAVFLFENTQDFKFELAKISGEVQAYHKNKR